MRTRLGDTIVALATARATSGLAVVRLSGPHAIECTRSVAKSVPDHRHASVRVLRDAKGQLIDEALLVHFAGPHSVTGEDVVEFHLHGNPLLADRLILQLCNAGARLAKGGEFTQRAVANGRMTLIEAEKIGSLIHAQSIEAAQAVAGQNTTELSILLRDCEQQLVAQLAQVEAWVDFSDADIEPDTTAEVAQRLSTIAADLADLAARYVGRRLWQHGIRVAIIGAPNAGKSSLMNHILGRKRALVSATAGTTRDYIEEPVLWHGLPLTLIDTAGVRDHGAGEIEQMGIESAIALSQQADCVLYLHDPREEPPMDDGLRPHPDWLQVDPGKVIHVYSFADVAPQKSTTALQICALDGTGCDLLAARITDLVGKADAAPVSLVSDRQAECARSAAGRIEKSAQMIAQHPPELVAEELYEALHDLQSLFGEYDRDRTLATVFSTFCVGK